MSAFDPLRRRCSGATASCRRAAPSREIVNPSTLKVEGRIALADAALAEAVAAEARAAQADWTRIDFKSRAALLHRVANSIEETDFHDVARLMTLEMGKPYPEAVGELANVAPAFRYFAEMARDEAGKIAGTTQAGSFQYRALRALWRLGPHHAVQLSHPADGLDGGGLAGGRQRLHRQAGRGDDAVDAGLHGAFRRCLPPGLVSCLPGGAETAQALIRRATPMRSRSPARGGGPRGGAWPAPSELKPCMIEAGGNDPMIISAHAPLEVAVAGSGDRGLSSLRPGLHLVRAVLRA